MRALALCKPNKDDCSVLKGYRPISLLLVIAKTMKTIVNEGLSKLL